MSIIEKYKVSKGLIGKPGRDGKDGKGIRGEKGEKGEPGKDGTSLTFDWRGTELGVGFEGKNLQYVDLKGKDGKGGTVQVSGGGLTPLRNIVGIKSENPQNAQVLAYNSTTKRYENGKVIHEEQVAWTREHYLQAIADLEAEITPRRLREAILGDGGWLKNKETEADALRKEMKAL